jgi:hypothetical protein
VIKKLNQITFVGFVLCVVMPIIEVKSRYLHGMENHGERLLDDLFDSWRGNWDDIILIFGYQPEVILIPIAMLIQGAIFLKNKKIFNKVGGRLDHYFTYLLLLIGIGFNLYFIDAGYRKHATELYFWFGAYIFAGLIVINLIVKYRHAKTLVKA